MEATEKEATKQECIRICRKLINSMETNKDDASGFFSGDILSAYRSITNQALKVTKDLQITISNL